MAVQVGGEQLAYGLTQRRPHLAVANIRWEDKGR
jgi:hypothetical protein